MSDEGNEQEKRRKAEFEQVCRQRVKTRMYSEDIRGGAGTKQNFHNLEL